MTLRLQRKDPEKSEVSAAFLQHRFSTTCFLQDIATSGQASVADSESPLCLASGD